MEFKKCNLREASGKMPSDFSGAGTSLEDVTSQLPPPKLPAVEKAVCEISKDPNCIKT